MNEALQSLLWIIVFPGFLFTACVGLIASWIDRKVSALVQWRVGPPFFQSILPIPQPFVDVMKLLGKETLIPQDAHPTVFIMSPVMGLAGVILLSTMLWRITIAPSTLFVGDIIVAIYLMIVPSLALVLGSSASASPHAAVGTAREMKLIMAYELSLVLAFIVVIIKTGGQVNLAVIAQQTPVFSISGLLAFLVALLCVQAKLGFVPFDIPEAETEIGSGVFMEYSGALLAIWKLVKAMMLVALPLFLVMVFLGGFGANIWAGIGKYVLILVLLILIKNTNPRVRIDQAMKFFWVYCGIAMAVAIILAILGNSYGINWL
ncbi:MAG: respiratory chain complex I subunit 1 family protein [Planctomycetota bacterium]|jgi:NADH-quinone oxidoreductase subunit H